MVGRLRMHAGAVLLHPCLHTCMVVTVIGGATIIAPVRMTSISLFNVSVEGAHAMFTGKMLHIRIVRGTKEYI